VLYTLLHVLSVAIVLYVLIRTVSADIFVYMKSRASFRLDVVGAMAIYLLTAALLEFLSRHL
jgi:hypothetical protein